MPTNQGTHGIANGHWERAESRSGWLLLLARMGVAELHTLAETALASRHGRGAALHTEPPHAGHEQDRSAVAAE